MVQPWNCIVWVEYIDRQINFNKVLHKHFITHLMVRSELFHGSRTPSMLGCKILTIISKRIFYVMFERTQLIENQPTKHPLLLRRRKVHLHNRNRWVMLCLFHTLFKFIHLSVMAKWCHFSTMRTVFSNWKKVH